MPLVLHRAERTDVLADALGELLARPLEDPFAREVVVVPARGVERWLAQRLSHRLGAAAGAGLGDGVCAGVRFLSPRSLVGLLLDRDREDPWDPDQLVWPLLGVIDGCLGEPGFEALSAHLGRPVGTAAPTAPDPRASRRYAVARRLAGLFSSYAVQRPRILADWRTGRDTDGSGEPLEADLAWQPELWRRLVGAVGAPAPDERHAAASAALAAGGAGLDLPARLSLFGHTRLPEAEVALLRSLAQAREVHLWLPQASARLWDALAPTAAQGPVPRRQDRSSEQVGHPLLASLGRDARELRRTLGPVDRDEALPGPAAPDTLLGWLQSDLRANREPDARVRAGRRPEDADRSVQVHACHGPARQVEVLREVLVGLLEDDPTLEPRDILVMCPDIEGYAPLVSAAFGLADLTPTTGDPRASRPVGHPAHRLRVRLADRAPGVTNPLLAVAATLVELAGGRVTATDVLDLAAAEPVRRRFGLDDDDLERLASWVDQAAVRWGLDGAHRADYGLTLEANTWLSGLRRLLLGAAVSAEGHREVRGVLPLDDVGDSDLELVGRVAELVGRLQAFVDEAGAAGGVAQWTAALRRGLAALTATDPSEAWQAAQLERELGRMAGAPGDAGPFGHGDGGAASAGPPLRQPDVRALLRQRLGGRPTRSGFRTGTLTVCTMVPMRSVPHRVVCLVGLDDEVFPRTATDDGDDVLARRPRTGERDPRAEDRQLLLDAVAAASDTLVVTYTGRGVHTGLERPPAVPLGELLDALDRTAAGPVRERVLVQHPLQPHDEQTMVPGRLGVPVPFTFDTSALAGARAAHEPRAHVRELVPEPLPPRRPGPGEGDDVALADLHDFLAHPARAFLRSRLRITTAREHRALRDGIPLALEPLERWEVGDRLVRDILDGAAPQEAMRAEQLRGLLPPGRLGTAELTGLKAEVRPLVERGLELRRGRHRVVDVDVTLRDGRRLTGTVGDLYGNDLVRIRFSRLSAPHRLASWIDALALAAGRPDENWTVHTVGKHRTGAQRALVPPLDDRAVGWLSDLVDVLDRARCEPLPLPVRTGLAWAEEHRLARAGREADPDAKARAEWETPRFSDAGFPREDSDAWHVRAFGEHPPYSCLTGPVRDHDLPGEGSHRLGRYAWAVWGPLLTEAGEQVRAL